jgi:uncharacterized protein YjbI with pentapeptide repeats
MPAAGSKSGVLSRLESLLTGQARPSPAAPLPPPLSPARLRVSGTYDQNWLETAWPGLPADFDFSALNLAQPGQILPTGPFLGDEPIAVSHMHPVHRTLTSALPGRRLRLLVKKTQPDGLSSAIELRNQLDTVWLFPNEAAALLIWHASLATMDEKAAEITEAIALLEDMAAQPLSLAAITALAGNGPGGLEALPISGAAGDSPPPPAPVPELREEPQAPPSPPAAADQPPIPDPPMIQKPIIPPAAVPLTAASVIAETQALLASQLPDVNRVLAEQGLPPMTMDDFAKELAEHEKALRTSLENLNSPVPSGESALAEELARMGYSPERAASFNQALKLPAPQRTGFATAAQFEEALDAYGTKWASLLGLPPENGSELARQLKLGQRALEGNVDEALEGLLGPRFSSPGLLSQTTPAMEKRLFISQMTAGGFSPEGAGKLHQTLTEARRLIESSANLPLAQKTARLKALGDKLDLNLNLPPGSTAQGVADNFRQIKLAAYSDNSLTVSLESLAAQNPELTKALPELNKLRNDPDQPFDSLADMAKAAGVSAPALLSSISSLDLLNPYELPAVFPGDSRPAEGEAAVPEASLPATGSQGQDPPLLFSDRDSVEIYLSGPGPKNLAGALMPGLDLRNLNFAGLDLSSADFRESDLSGADFSGAILHGCNLSGAKMAGISLVRADLSGASLAGTSLTRGDLREAVLDLADLYETDLSEAVLGALSARGATFTGVKLPLDLSRAVLDRARLIKVDLFQTSFRGAQLSGAEFNGCNLSQADFTDAVSPEVTFILSDLSQAKLTRVTADRARFLAGCILDEADFSHSALTEANLSGLPARRANFTGIKAPRADLSQMDLRETVFAGAYLRGAVLFRSDLSGADIRGADLFRANLGGARLNAADLRRSSLYGCDLYRAAVDKATRFQGADLNSTCLTLNKIPVVSN